MCHRLHLLWAVDVGGHRNAELSSRAGKDLESLRQSRTPIGTEPRAIGLVKARLEYEGHGNRGADGRQLSTDPHDRLGALDHAGAGDDHQRVAAAKPDPGHTVSSAYVQGVHHRLRNPPTQRLMSPLEV